MFRSFSKTNLWTYIGILKVVAAGKVGRKGEQSPNCAPPCSWEAKGTKHLPDIARSSQPLDPSHTIQLCRYNTPDAIIFLPFAPFSFPIPSIMPSTHRVLSQPWPIPSPLQTQSLIHICTAALRPIHARIAYIHPGVGGPVNIPQFVKVRKILLPKLPSAPRSTYRRSVKYRCKVTSKILPDTEREQEYG